MNTSLVGVFVGQADQEQDLGAAAQFGLPSPTPPDEFSLVVILGTRHHNDEQERVLLAQVVRLEAEV